MMRSHPCGARARSHKRIAADTDLIADADSLLSSKLSNLAANSSEGNPE
jgi:hypothetical protein